eukprot:gene339-51588_t
MFKTAARNAAKWEEEHAVGEEWVEGKWRVRLKEKTKPAVQMVQLVQDSAAHCTTVPPPSP